MRRGSKHNLSRDEYLSGMTYAYAPRGNDLPHAKLTPDKVREIRASNETGAALAKKLGIHENTVYAVRRYERWGWVA
jgi:hypothetical protein